MDLSGGALDAVFPLLLLPLLPQVFLRSHSSLSGAIIARSLRRVGLVGRGRRRLVGSSHLLDCKLVWRRPDSLAELGGRVHVVRLVKAFEPSRLLFGRRHLLIHTVHETRQQVPTVSVLLGFFHLALVRREFAGVTVVHRQRVTTLIRQGVVEF